MSDYAAFLAMKRRVVSDAGVDVPSDNLSPRLFDFQRDITRWALARQRGGGSRHGVDRPADSGGCIMTITLTEDAIRDAYATLDVEPIAGAFVRHDAVDERDGITISCGAARTVCRRWPAGGRTKAAGAAERARAIAGAPGRAADAAGRAAGG